MSIYKYSAINILGEQIVEIDEADDFSEICRNVIKRKYFITTYRKLYPKFVKLNPKDVIIFLKHIKYQRGEALSLISSIESYIRITDNYIMQFFLKKVLRNLKSGESLSYSFGFLFDYDLLGFFLALEKTGDFNDLIDAIIKHIEMKNFIKENLIKKLRYPIISFGFIFCIFLAFIEFLLPSVTEMLGRPLLLNSIVVLYKFIFLLSICFALLCIFSDKFLVINNITKNFVIRLNNWCFTTTLLISVKSKIPLIKSIKIAALSVKNKYVQHDVFSLSRDLENGYSVSKSMAIKKFFTKNLIEFMSIAEINNKFENILHSYNKIEKAYIMSKIKDISNIAVISVTLFSGVLLLSIILGIFMPMYNSLFNIDINL